MNDIVFYGIWVIVGLIMLVYYAKRKRTLTSSIVGMGSGMVALLLLHYFGESINFTPELSLFNTMTALILGVPGVIMMIVVNKL
ncbi:hypothetical protein FACS1894132_08920 [Clostridia bacterium]|nr:hypothetical protein FACS1894132_08920 [Clostridia bacterium]